MSLSISVASLVVPGVGQALIGKRWRAIAWAAAGLVSVVALVVSVWMVVGIVAVRVAGAVDGALQMRKHDVAKWNARLALVTAAFAAATLAFDHVAFDAVAIPSTSMAPTLEVDDRVLVETLGRAPARGDVIVFEHPCQPGLVYIKRVVAVAGETIEVRCGVAYVDGAAVPHELVEAQVAYDDVDDVAGARARRTYRRSRETLAGHTYDVFDLDPPAKDFPIDHLVRTCGANPLLGTLVPTKNAASACEPQEHYVVPAGSVFVLGDHRAVASDSRAWGPVPLGNVRGRAIGIWRPLARLGGL